MKMNAIGVLSTSTPSTIEVAYNNETFYNEIFYNETSYNETSYNMTMELDQVLDILWSYYNQFYEDPNYLLIALYVPAIALAVTANILVIVVVFKYHYMRSVTNYFVVNLSVADLLVAVICMPMAVSQSVSIVWIHGEFMCKLSCYLQGVSVAASVFTITAMSIDRYLAIRSPMAFRRVFNRRTTVFVIIFIWLMALGTFIPVIKGMTLVNPTTNLIDAILRGPWEVRGNISDIEPEMPTFYICFEDFTPLGFDAYHFGTACFILIYAIPGFIVILAYSMMGRTLCSRKPPFDCDSVEGSASSQQSFRLVRERKRIAWILLLVAILFALCWLPYNVLRLLADFDLVDVKGKSTVKAITYCLFVGHANSALNPVIYCFMTRKFRRSVLDILRRNPHGLAHRKPRRKSVMIVDDRGGFNVPGNARRGFLRQRNVPGCGCSIPMGGHHAALTLRRTGTSSSDDSFHSPHRRCYKLRSIRHVSQTAMANLPANAVNGDHRQEQQHHQQQQQQQQQQRPEYEKNNGIESSQPQQSTLCITIERVCP